MKMFWEYALIHDSPSMKTAYIMRYYNKMTNCPYNSDKFKTVSG